MTRLDERELQKKLEAEGFTHTFVWQDGPRAHYPNHTHAGLTAHIILDGEMTLTMEGSSQTYRAGERMMCRLKRSIPLPWEPRDAAT